MTDIEYVAGKCSLIRECEDCPISVHWKKKNCPCKGVLRHGISDGDIEEMASVFREFEGRATRVDIPEFVPDEQHDPVAHPAHYTHGGMECIDEMVVVFGKNAVMDFCLLNVWKYRKRAMYKNGEEDMKKADWYMAKYRELKGYADE